MQNIFDKLIKDSYMLRKEHGEISGIMYGAVSSVGFSQVEDINGFVDNGNIDMLHLRNPITDEEVDIYKSNLINYKIKRGERRIYILTSDKPEQSIMF